MFNWKRPQDMPITEPTEEQIWQVIESVDPHYTASIKDRLSWHQEMLEDRNIYENTFARTSRMPMHGPELILENNPTNWVTNLNLQHADDVPLEKIVDRLSTGPQDVLQPAMDSAVSTGIVHLLSYYILRNEAKDWDPKSVFGTPLAAVTGYVEWARYHLTVHHSVLRKAGVYQAIYASLFDYSRLPFAWIRGIAEHWDKTTNTCWLGPHELTITLADIQDITGLPVFGTPYEECVPPDFELFQRVVAEGERKGKFIYSTELHKALSHYQKFFRNRKGSRRCRGAITLDLWSESFLSKDARSVKYARLSDPFDIGAQVSQTSFNKRFEPEGQIYSRQILAPEIDEETSLVAFIATWLCYFVFPAKNKLFRPSTLLMASLIARGERIAIAPASLAYIYSGLGRVSAMTDARRYDIEAPWHFLHGWIHAHISGSFSCAETPGYFREQRFPSIMQLSKATTSIGINQIRTFMFAPLRMVDRFQIIHRTKMQNLSIQQMDHHFMDTLTEGNTPILLSKSAYMNIVEYYVGIRPAWLCYRRNESVILQGYNPNRVARQFGFSQATPVYGLPQIPNIEDVKAMGAASLRIRLETAASAWDFIFRLGTGSTFYIAPQSADTGISHLWLRWIRHTFSSFLEMGFGKYCHRIHKPKNIERATTKMTVEKESDRGQHRGSSSVHRDHSSSSHSRRDSKRSREISPHSLHHGEARQPDSLPVDSGEVMSSKRRRSVSPLAHQNVNQEEPASVPETLESNENAHESDVNVHEPNDDIHEIDENVRELNESVHEPDENMNEPEANAREDSNDVPPSADRETQHSDNHRNEHTSEEHAASNSAEDENMLQPSEDREAQHSDNHQDEHISGEPSMEAIAEVVEAEERHSHPSISILEPISNLEMTDFVSAIRTRNAGSSRGRFSQSLGNIITTLRELVLDINIEALPDLNEFRDMTNSLLDCAVISGINAQELQHWESLLRNVEFGIYSIQNAQEEGAIEESEAAKAAYNEISERAMIAYENLQRKLTTFRSCQKNIMWANAEIVRIAMELKKLQKRKQFLIQKREAVSQDIAIMESDFAQIETEISELEQIHSPLSQQLETATQHLQAVQDKHQYKVAQARAAMACIREIQSRCA